ncbi:Hypothetical predicted protein [Cloeon dipterum]|uniref:Sushi domain-containing protein n=1 Tax=Cloeon dipterum TaxID=197152 RepID=A0A8S1DGK9_9INSE|nr:Hypothetical predicted protein [Cloeon dipterum]
MEKVAFLCSLLLLCELKMLEARTDDAETGGVVLAAFQSKRCPPGEAFNTFFKRCVESFDEHQESTESTVLNIAGAPIRNKCRNGQVWSNRLNRCITVF